MNPIWASFLLGIVAGIGVALVLNLRATLRVRPGRRSSKSIALEAERWLAEGGDRRDP